MDTRVILLPAVPLRAEALWAVCDSSLLAVADCYVEGVEAWTPVDWGWRATVDSRTAFNVDHHADDERFFRQVSSGNLAIRYVAAEGPLPADARVIINHTDCDSVISASILAGLLPPDAVFGDAVIAADHTGAPNAIADLLQALDPLRDFVYSLASLRSLMRGELLDGRAAELLADRHAERARAQELVASGAFQAVGRVAVAKLTRGQKVAGEFLPSLLPEAAAIVSASPMENGRWETKVRLGSAARVGETLYSLGVRTFEPSFRGRWNAGSTKRSGGSTVEPELLAEYLAGQLAASR